MLLREKDTIRKGQIDKNMMELETNDSKKYKIEAIYDSAIYARESKSGYLLRFYYLVF